MATRDETTAFHLLWSASEVRSGSTHQRCSQQMEKSTREPQASDQAYCCRGPLVSYPVEGRLSTPPVPVPRRMTSPIWGWVSGHQIDSPEPVRPHVFRRLEHASIWSRHMQLTHLRSPLTPTKQLSSICRLALPAGGDFRVPCDPRSETPHHPHSWGQPAADTSAGAQPARTFACQC